ncbi:MAG: hypothetical protein CMC46_00870 [Flavobacteriaceae bacterium]|nr:hypothetical protein [Flavobacteriaceae bacterium]|tara:strand:- start:143 stop:403 length:261 start_codon:yes stop_codon:yes gene_type:complete
MKKVFKVLVIITAIFLYLALGLSHLEIESTLFGVFWELLILPAFFLQFSLSITLIFLIAKGEQKIEKYSLLNFITTTLLILSLIFL